MKYIIAALLAGLVAAAMLTAVIDDAQAPKASSFNQAIHERNGSDERAVFLDKRTVKDALNRGCVPQVPKDKNQNITALCPIF